MDTQKRTRRRYQKFLNRYSDPPGSAPVWQEWEGQIIGDFAVPRGKAYVVHVPSGMHIGPDDCGSRKAALAFAQALHDAQWWVGTDEFSRIIPETTEGKRDEMWAIWLKVLQGQG